MDVTVLPALADNYIYLLRERGDAFVVDPGVAAPVRDALAAQDLTLRGIMLTHYHSDHIGGVAALRTAFPGTTLYLPKHEANEIPGVKPDTDHLLVGGDTFVLGSWSFRALALPGHSKGHMGFYTSGHLFCGDVLMPLGCGRVFTDDYRAAWESLRRIRALPDETLTYFGHEYTGSNLRFMQHIGMDIPPEIIAQAQKEKTAPFLLGIDKAYNGFLRADRPEVAALVGLENRPGWEVFKTLRQQKDAF
ncbi:MAG: hydroxyacylglutathione hydrolase [Pseudomonadota bacterium]